MIIQLEKRKDYLINFRATGDTKRQLEYISKTTKAPYSEIIRKLILHQYVSLKEERGESIDDI